MNLGPPDWRKIASIEMTGSIGMLRHVLATHHDGYILQLADESPPGRTWVDVFVDFGLGEHRGVRAAQSVMNDLTQAAVRGNIKPFRVLAGDHWLRDDGARSADREGEPGRSH